jgi:hypothetical protein
MLVEFLLGAVHLPSHGLFGRDAPQYFYELVISDGSPYPRVIPNSLKQSFVLKLTKAETSDQPIFKIGILARNGNTFTAYHKTPVEILENKGTC